METSKLFYYFCSVQHRLNVSPQAAALFFYLLGEFSRVAPKSGSIALANARICGTIHISPAALRKCRDMLVAARIISFSSADQGKTPALYSFINPSDWLLDVVSTPETDQTAQTAQPQPDTETGSVTYDTKNPEEPTIASPAPRECGYAVLERNLAGGGCTIRMLTDNDIHSAAKLSTVGTEDSGT